MACLAHIALLAAQPNKPTCWGGSPATTLSAGPAGTSTMAIGPGYIRIVLFTAVAWNFYPSFCRSWLTHHPVLRFVQTNYTTLQTLTPTSFFLLPLHSPLSAIHPCSARCHPPSVDAPTTHGSDGCAPPSRGPDLVAPSRHPCVAAPGRRREAAHEQDEEREGEQDGNG